ncbi:MAG: cytochrome C [Firmicutes bacterium]|nr:cytochrome C [Bacillota bacterium]MDY2720147.1 cytochrome C [Candidatus Faecousia sp.]
MPTISKKELKDYQQLCKDRNNGHILTPDGLRLVCEGLNKDPETVGKHFLEVLARFQAAKKR